MIRIYFGTMLSAVRWISDQSMPFLMHLIMLHLIKDEAAWGACLYQTEYNTAPEEIISSLFNILLPWENDVNKCHWDIIGSVKEKWIFCFQDFVKLCWHRESLLVLLIDHNGNYIISKSRQSERKWFRNAWGVQMTPANDFNKSYSSQRQSDITSLSGSFTNLLPIWLEISVSGGRDNWHIEIISHERCSGWQVLKQLKSEIWSFSLHEN